MSGPLLLSIESSCDETGIAVVDGGRRILSNVVASQVALHAPTGGIVPELAARAHLRWIVPTLDEAWTAAGVDWRAIDGIAVDAHDGAGRRHGQDAVLPAGTGKDQCFAEGLPIPGQCDTVR